MRAGTSAAGGASASACEVCGAQLDALHVDMDRTGAHCSFCGSTQRLPSGQPDLQLVTPNWTPDLGETLRTARQARGETLEQAARFTQIRIHFLRDLESGEVTSLEPYPGRVYARFFLRDYARHLDLDPGPLLRRFDKDAEPALLPARPTRISRRPPRPGRWAVAALVVLVAILTIATLVSRSDRVAPLAIGGRNPTPAAPDPQPEHAEPSTPEPPVRGIHVVIRMTMPCWVRAISDGEIDLAETIPSGETIRLHATRTMELRLGNAGGVTLTVNGRPVPTGEDGSVQDLTLTRKGARVVVT